MEIGFVFATSDVGNDPCGIRDYVQAAEELGYDSVLMYDHVLGAVHDDRDPPLPGPYDETFAFHEPFVTLGYLAGLTTRIELSTGVLVSTQRQTALVAKQAAEIQVLSGGRLRLGVGSGWNRVECEALGMSGSWGRRGRLLTEQVHLLRKLWGESVVSFEGEFHRIDRAGINPLPGSQIPIWFGGKSEAAYRRAARIGDGFIFRPDDQMYGRDLGRIRSQLESEGRHTKSFGAECFVSHGLGPAHWRKALNHWTEAGGTRISVQSMHRGAEKLGAVDSGAATIERQIACLEEFMRVMRPGGPEVSVSDAPDEVDRDA